MCQPILPATIPNGSISINKFCLHSKRRISPSPLKVYKYPSSVFLVLGRLGPLETTM